MAVLWEQRELLKTLKELQLEELREEAKLHAGEEFPSFILDADGVWWMDENIVIDRILKNRGKSLNDWDELLSVRLLIDASIDSDQFLKKTENDEYEKDSENPNLVNTSRRAISINPAKGPEILNGVYFWGKYIPEIFPHPSQVVVAVATGVLSAIAITYLS